jgi:glyceraldehyde 3-phosphate dehydrogenase
MAIRIAINGFGRIGRNVFRIAHKDPGVEIVAINDLAPVETLAHLLKYDTTMGRFKGTETAGKGALSVDGKEIKVHSAKEISDLPWKSHEVYCVVESTGVFRRRDQCAKHLEAGAKKVVLTVPADGDIDATIVLGVNDGDLSAAHHVISNASCTTNCLAPMAKILNDSWGIESGLMNTIHAFTADQRLQDMVHSDLRRARAATHNIIPTTTGAARAVGSVIPSLKGKLNGL